MARQIDLAEALLATIGVSPIIKNEFPRIGPMTLRKATNINERIDEKIKSLVTGGVSFPKLPRPHNYDALLDRMTEEYPANETRKIIDSFPVDAHAISLPFTVLAQDAFNHLRQLLPISSVNNFAGPVNIQPGDVRLWTFYSQLALLDDALRVLDLIGTAALLPSQAKVVRLFFPTISAYIDRAIVDAVKAKRATNDKYQLPAQVEIGLARWKGARAIEFNPKKPQQPQPLTRTPKSLKAGDLASVGQKGSSS
jgi:hypothetical protein